MKKTLFLWLIAVPMALPAQTAKIKIDIDRTIGEIDPKIYGVFMEPIEFNPRRFGSDDTIIHNTLYGTLYDPASPLANENGFKKNFIEAAKELKITNMRWPGGEIMLPVITGRTVLARKTSDLFAESWHGALLTTTRLARTNGYS